MFPKMKFYTYVNTDDTHLCRFCDSLVCAIDFRRNTHDITNNTNLQMLTVAVKGTETNVFFNITKLLF